MSVGCLHQAMLPRLHACGEDSGRRGSPGHGGGRLPAGGWGVVAYKDRARPPPPRGPGRGFACARLPPWGQAYPTFRLMARASRVFLPKGMGAAV